MRVWEFEDNKAIPSDLVREQDFILRVRRMQRNGTTSLVLNFILNAIEPLAKNHELLEAAQKKLQEYAASTKGACFEMSNGDIFMVWEQAGDARIVAGRAVDAALPEYKANLAAFLLTYRMPDNYALLRERTNHYVDAVRASSTVGTTTVHMEDSRGKLTAKNVDQIEHLLGEIDLRRYGRTQSIYHDVKGVWQAVGEEYFVSFEDLRRERFPKLEIVSSEHFFFAICGLLDQKLLSMLTTTYETIANRLINLNLSIVSIMGSVFAQFARTVPHDKRNLICFELHRGDLLQDFSLTLSAIDALRHEGFRVAIDSITPDMLPYVNLGLFDVDAIKINVSKDRVLQLGSSEVLRSLKQIAPEKLIFFRCDNDQALVAGRKLGVTTFQGWHIDDVAAKKS